VNISRVIVDCSGPTVHLLCDEIIQSIDGIKLKRKKENQNKSYPSDNFPK